MASKKVTMQDCFNELERVCRIITEQKVEENELPMFRKCLQSSLTELTKMRQIKADKAAEKRLAKIKAENERLLNRRK